MYSYNHPEYLNYTVKELLHSENFLLKEINYLLHEGDILTFCTQNDVNFWMYFCLILKAICKFMLIWRVPHHNYFSTDIIMKSSQVSSGIKTIYAPICFLYGNELHMLQLVSCCTYVHPLFKTPTFLINATGTNKRHTCKKLEVWAFHFSSGRPCHVLSTLKQTLPSL